MAEMAGRNPHNCQQVTANEGPLKNKPKVGPGPFKTCFGAFQNFKIEPKPLQNRAQRLQIRGPWPPRHHF